ncbi:hypothetical protein BS50DRAFT_628467 [Corynespora cassiicola Philippines]|uniref:Uncharacterized protein n=1 Tax=Corynespora cassiicola Philippines TaxID=1448308 RepID=A0A2T2PC81_CORCC|nr:hypothetical protein BS50DRAFT_628467 [Corynespora cassiicola Philippines]
MPTQEYLQLKARQELLEKELHQLRDGISEAASSIPQAQLEGELEPELVSPQRFPPYIIPGTNATEPECLPPVSATADAVYVSDTGMQTKPLRNANECLKVYGKHSKPKELFPRFVDNKPLPHELFYGEARANSAPSKKYPITYCESGFQTLSTEDTELSIKNSRAEAVEIVNKCAPIIEAQGWKIWCEASDALTVHSEQFANRLEVDKEGKVEYYGKTCVAFPNVVGKKIDNEFGPAAPESTLPTVFRAIPTVNLTIPVDRATKNFSLSDDYARQFEVPAIEMVPRKGTKRKATDAETTSPRYEGGCRKQKVAGAKTISGREDCGSTMRKVTDVGASRKEEERPNKQKTIGTDKLLSQGDGRSNKQKAVDAEVALNQGVGGSDKHTKHVTSSMFEQTLSIKQPAGGLKYTVANPRFGPKKNK